MSDYNSIFTGTEIDDTISLIKNGIELQSGTDLNTVFTPGWYYGLGTNSYTNRPIISRNFVLCVFPSADGSSTGERVGQLFITTGYTSTASSTYPSAMYVRGVRRTRSTSSSSYSYTTTGWTSLATSTDISSLSNDISSLEDKITSSSVPQYTCGTLCFTTQGGYDTTSTYRVINFIPSIIKVYFISQTSSTGSDAQLCTVLTPPTAYGSSYTNVNTIWNGSKLVDGHIAEISKGKTYYWRPMGSIGYYVYEIMGYKETT